MKRSEFRAVLRAFPQIASVVRDPQWHTAQGAQVLRDLKTMLRFQMSFTHLMRPFHILESTESEGWTDDVQQLVDYITEKEEPLFGGPYGDDDDDKDDPNKKKKKPPLIDLDRKQVGLAVAQAAASAVAVQMANRAANWAFGVDELSKEKQKVLEAIEHLEKLKNAAQPVQQQQQPMVEYKAPPPPKVEYKAPVQQQPTTRKGVMRLADYSEDLRRQWFRNRFQEYVQQNLMPVRRPGGQFDYLSFGTDGGLHTTCLAPEITLKKYYETLQLVDDDFYDPVHVNEVARKAGIKTFKEFLDDTGVSDYQNYAPDGRQMHYELQYDTARVLDQTIVGIPGVGTVQVIPTTYLAPGESQPQIKLAMGTACQGNGLLSGFSSLFVLWMAILFILLFWRTWKSKPKTTKTHPLPQPRWSEPPRKTLPSAPSLARFEERMFQPVERKHVPPPLTQPQKRTVQQQQALHDFTTYNQRPTPAPTRAPQLSRKGKNDPVWL